MTSFKEEWIKTQTDSIRLVMPCDEMSDRDLRLFLENEYSAANISEGRFFNNTTNEVYSMTNEGFINTALNSGNILSGASVFFENQDKHEAVTSGAIQCLINTRKQYKKQMFDAQVKGNTAEFLTYSLWQLIYKILVNSFYGVTGMPGSIFMNRYCQNSVTLTGRDAITSTIMAMEEFLANNIYLRDSSDAITYIKNIISEKTDLQILDVVDAAIPANTVFDYVYNKIEIKKVGDDKLISSILNSLSPEMVTRVYYKNQLLPLINNEWFKRNIEPLTHSKFTDPNNIPDEIDAPLAIVRERMVSHAFYPFINENRFDRAYTKKRKCVIITATDSNFICLDAYVKYVAKNFGLDPTHDKERKIWALNIFISAMTEALTKTFYVFTKNLNVIERHRGTIRMKNEYVYSRILNTENKNCYAGSIICREGNVYDKPKFDVKGFGFDKATTAPILSDEWGKILEERILAADVLNIDDISDDIEALKNRMAKSLSAGELTYSRPGSIEQTGRYKAPIQILSWRGTSTWNELEPTQEIAPPGRVNILTLKTKKKPVDCPVMLEFQRDFPDKYKIVAENVYQVDVPAGRRNGRARFGFDYVCLPKNIEKAPEYLTKLIDVDASVDYNLNSGMIMLKALGIHCFKGSDKINRITSIIDL